ncbi:MAG: histidine phosphotransferase family protein [Pseudomonadota bacterium]
MSQSNQLPALISSRICHDLASPLMAIANGLEFLEMTGFAGTPEADLLADSVKSARARMEFFRIAFGAASPDGRIGARQAQTALGDHFRDRKIDAVWDVSDDVSRVEAKRAFLLAQCCETAMPRGGSVRITRPGAVWQIAAETPVVKEVSELWEVLQGGHAEIGSAHVHFLLAYDAADGRGIVVDLSEGAITVRLG